MGEVTIAHLLDKIIHLCRDAQLPSVPSFTCALSLSPYLHALDSLRNYLLPLQEEYLKLEELLQKQETQIRRRVGIEQQFKLYTQTLKAQVEQLQCQKAQLLTNTKVYIKDLKRTNEGLFAELHQVCLRGDQNRGQSLYQSPNKPAPSKHYTSLSQHKSQQNKSLRDIVRTQYLQKQRSHSGHLKKSKQKTKAGVHSTIRTTGVTAKAQSNTFQVISTSNKEQPKASRKRNKHVFSNFTLLNFMDQHKNQHRVRSPGVKKGGGRSRGHNSSKWTQKKANKSIFSVKSMGAGEGRKETT